MKVSENINIYNLDSLDVYNQWLTPTVIISDGPYGIGGFPGDPQTADSLSDWYRPHIKEWSNRSTPNTTLWFWNTELGWANVHAELISNDWEFVNCHIWDKGKEHIAGNVNTKTIRHFPVVTEVCAQYVKKAIFNIDSKRMTMQEWLRYEWQRSGLPFSKTNEACEVVNAASRKYFTNCHLWYFPPSEAFEKFALYANKFGKEEGKPYFSIDGKKVISKKEWEGMRAKFKCEFGINNVWREPPLNGKERLKNGSKSIHLNQKPLKFMERIIKASSDIGDVIWEPFGGLFSGMIATHNLGRIGYGAEISEPVFEIGIKRIENELPLLEKIV
ncbi:DNA methyltransferase [uncultured Elizabethkingia sp.]|uniref:DNA methyltransferase n=1 Tax=uncultured Elizabethkingia sp. TaxID=432638 RepID=UPI0025939A23|nr:DNA methyltransferase [uncultured Elizabethkingia sp.]